LLDLRAGAPQLPARPAWPEIETRLAASRQTLDLLLDVADGAGLSWLHRHTEVMTRSLQEDGRLAVTVRADPANAEKVRAKFGS